MPRCATVASSLIRSERVAELYAAIEKLPAEDREIIMLHDMEQLSFKVIAAKFSSKEATMRCRHFRALQELKGKFPPQMIGELEEPEEG